MEYCEQPGQYTITAKVIIVEPLGAETHLYLNTGKHDFAARVNLEKSFSMGQTVAFLPNMQKSKFFTVADDDSKEERNICEDIISE
jgi:multiple sugar transport system ATP-binding protein